MILDRPLWSRIDCHCDANLVRADKQPPSNPTPGVLHAVLVRAIRNWLATVTVWVNEVQPEKQRWIDPWRQGDWEVAANLDRFARSLHGDQPVIGAMATCPLAVKESLTSFLKQELDSLQDVAVREVVLWALTTAFIDAAWRAIGLDGPDVERNIENAPRLARARFHLLTVPQRVPLADQKYFLTPGMARPEQATHVASKAVGEGGRYGIALRSARAVWASILNSYQSYPVLGLSGAELERETDLLAFADDQHTRLLATDGESPGRPATCAADQTHLVQIEEQHFLPRFRIDRVWRLDRIRRPATTGRQVLEGFLARWAPVSLIILSLVATGLACWLHAQHQWFRWGAIFLVAVALLVAGIDSMSARPGAATKWLWRLPAASVVGVLLLIALSKTWWVSLSQRGAVVLLEASAVLVLSSYGYLLLEARNHGVEWRSAWPRALVVFGFAGAHSYAVVTIGLNLVGRVFMDGAVQLSPGDPPPIKELLDDPWRYLILVVVSTAWCVTAGVFSQILWDDRPITAPVAHMRWTKGG